MSKTKSTILGMSFGTARSRLVKMLLFDLVKKAELNRCYRCSKQIETIDEFSIEHTESWQFATDPQATYFDLSKISYSHIACNSRAITRPPRVEHGPAGYKRGCRCDPCVAANKVYNSNWTEKRRSLRPVS